MDDQCHADGDILGADDAAGIQILWHLMGQGVPAYYVFTRGEEIGGVGAEYLAHSYHNLLKQFDRAIAFDRKDVWSIITRQAGQRCASDEFAEALSNQFNDLGLIYADDPSGIFTDTALWTEHIKECTNLSCGYYHQHTTEEWQDLAYLSLLMDAAAKIDWEALPTVGTRDGGEMLWEIALERAAEGKPDSLKNLLVEEGWIKPSNVDQYRYREAAKACLAICHEFHPMSWEDDVAEFILDNIVGRKTLETNSRS